MNPTTTATLLTLFTAMAQPTFASGVVETIKRLLRLTGFDSNAQYGPPMLWALSVIMGAITHLAVVASRGTPPTWMDLVTGVVTGVMGVPTYHVASAAKAMFQRAGQVTISSSGIQRMIVDTIRMLPLAGTAPVAQATQTTASASSPAAPQPEPVPSSVPAASPLPAGAVTSYALPAAGN